MSMSMTPAHAISLTILDPSFESEDFCVNCFTNGGPDTFWDIEENAGYHNLAVSIDPGSIDGNDVAWSSSGKICQVLGDTITGDTQYDLSVWVGDRTNFVFPGFEIELLNGNDDTLLASINHNTGNKPANGFWALNILTHTVLGGDPSIGDPLKICLYSPNNPQIVFDAVSLDATSTSILIGGTVGSIDTVSLLVAGAQANMSWGIIALVGAVAVVGIAYKAKTNKTHKETL